MLFEPENHKIEGKFYLIKLETQVGYRGAFDCTVLGVVLGKYDDLDVSSGKSLSVSFYEPLIGTLENVWVGSKLDKFELVEVEEDEYFRYWLDHQEEVE